jgi:hypothetical protein
VGTEQELDRPLPSTHERVSNQPFRDPSYIQELGKGVVMLLHLLKLADEKGSIVYDKAWRDEEGKEISNKHQLPSFPEVRSF